MSEELKLRFRQVHLDFHTSEAIPGIGADFDADTFAETLANAHVDSVTCFARGHHGWLYYDSKYAPERVHPHLENKNLLDEQIAACHARGIRVPIYITVQWDHYTAQRHPEWVAVSEEGQLLRTPPYEAGFYRYMCLNTPYVDWLKGNVKEVLEHFDPVDGLFLDIVQPRECSCYYCKQGMIERGIDPSVRENRLQYALEVLNTFKRDMSAFIREINPDCTIFYNAGHIGTRHREVKDAYSHWELESLPSGGWGYMHFPIAMRYARTLGKECLGMTGKFHTSWGDFHSFKNEAALQFECFQMLALGAKCSVGDQLPPSGKIDAATYDLIGSVYGEVEKKEPWCTDVEPVVDIGVFTPEEFGGLEAPRVPVSMMGAVRMLQEGGWQFDIIDTQADFGKYKVLVLPDEIPVEGAFAKKLAAYVKKGGALLASYKSGLDAAGQKFAKGLFGVERVGEAPYSPDFLLPAGTIGEGLPETEHVMYLRGLEVKAGDDATVLTNIVNPYFNRTWEHFCSHRHTPSAGKTGSPGIVQKGSVIYFAHPIFTQYGKNAPRWVKTLFANALKMLLPEPVLEIEAPTTTLTALNAQPGEDRWVLHILHYIPERRGQDFDIIEDVIPIYGVKVRVRVPDEVTEVSYVPRGETIAFKQDGDVVEFTALKVEGHQMIELKF